MLDEVRGKEPVDLVDSALGEDHLYGREYEADVALDLTVARVGLVERVAGGAPGVRIAVGRRWPAPGGDALIVAVSGS